MRRKTACEFLRGFGYAFAGLRLMFGTEFNAVIHGIVAVGVIVAGFRFDISASEWIAITLCIGIVFAAEAFNSAIERMCNRLTTQREDAIKEIKDISAGAVLVTALASVVVGLVIFAPKVLALHP